MSVTPRHLFRAAAVCAAAAGAIFLAVQIGHPPMEAASAATADWVVRSWAKAAMAVLALAGITAMYLRQLGESRLLGLIGYAVFAFGYLVMFAVEAIAATVLPALVASEPAFVDDVIVSAAGGAPQGDIGGVQALLSLSGVGYLAGGLIFGIALFRARVLSRAASILLAVGTVATAALAVLPEWANRPLAVPVGVALIWLGVSLWRSVRVPQTAASASPLPARADAR